MNLLADIVAETPALTRIRRDIHAHPELAFEEERTAALVATLLEGWGIEVHRGLGGTGLVGVVRHGDSARAVGLRADMDALPMTEANGFAHASRTPGKMHACGHDGHTTMLLGAAQHLARTRDFDGTVYLIFQPAEEIGGGAPRMIADGLLERFPMQAVFGLHNMPGIAEGLIAASPGPVLASNSKFEITVRGRGGHGAMPQLALDPLPAAAQIVLALQTIVSRNRAPHETAVLSVTQVHAGDTFNVIPDQCVLGGTARAYSQETVALIERRMREVAAGICAAHGLECDVTFETIYPPTVNHAAETAFARRVAAELVGEAAVIEQTPIMAAEDFSYLLQRVPGSYCFLGNGDGAHRDAGHGAGPCTVHNTSYDFNDALLPIGASYLARVAERWLGAQDAPELLKP